VDYDAVRRMVGRALKYDIKLFNMTGGNTRYAYLSYEEVKELTRVMAEAVHPRGILMACTSNYDLNRALDYARFAESVGADALQVLAPAESVKGEALVEYYKAIAHKVKLPLSLGNQSLPKPIMHQLLQIPSLVAMKEDSDLSDYIFNLVDYGDRLNIYSGGSQARFLAGYPYGARAYFCSYATFAPWISREFWAAIQRRDLELAYAMCRKYDMPWIENVVNDGFWPATLEYFGLTSRYQRPPLKTFNNQEMEEVRNFYIERNLYPRPLGD
jgi:dihydrodipicolinate synthase/N-acetylneuraminate lyase